MSLRFNGWGHGARRAGLVRNVCGCCSLGAALFAWTIGGSLSVTVHAGQSRAVNGGVYTDQQAKRGEATYMEQCSACHGQALQGDLAPPLAGDDFIATVGKEPLSELVNKIINTMPADAPGELSRQQAADLVAYVLQVGEFAAGSAELSSDEAALKQITWPEGALVPPAPIASTAAEALLSQPVGNMAQLMRGILFPSSNLIFNVQGQDPSTPKAGYEPSSTASFSWADWGAGIYSGWELVDYAAVALADSAPLLLTPRRCENGKPAPVEREDWVRFTQELAEAGRAAYRASQSRNQDAVSEVTGQIADSCLNCHQVYRDKPRGNNPADPSNKAARCVP